MRPGHTIRRTPIAIESSLVANQSGKKFPERMFARAEVMFALGG
jgi:hypothetical protein